MDYFDDFFEESVTESGNFETSTAKAFIDGYFEALESVSTDVKNAVNEDIKEMYKCVKNSRKSRAYHDYENAIKYLMEAKSIASRCDKNLSKIKDDDSTLQNILSHLNPRYLFDTKGSYVKTGEKEKVVDYRSYKNEDGTHGVTIGREYERDAKKYVNSRLNKKNMNVKNAQLHRAHAIIQNMIVYCNEEIKNLKADQREDSKMRK